MSFECEQDIGITSDFKMLKTQMGVWAKIKRFPLHAAFELTPLCNLRCPMCYVRLDSCGMVRQGGRIHSGEEWLEIGRQSVEMGTMFVTLTGGEPLLHPDFWDIYNGLTEMGVLVTILTNGCLIDEQVIEKFKENPPFNMKISIYGASDETYEKMCGVKNGFTRVSRAIDLLREADMPFFCTCTVVNQNLHDLPAVYAFAAQKGIKFMHTTAVTLSARDAVSDPLHARTDVTKQFWTLESLEKEKHKNDLRPFAYCGGYGTNYFLTWHWHLGFCGFSPKPYAQVADAVDLEASWKEMLEKADKIKTPEKCVECEDAEFCKRCPGLISSESGDPEQVSDTFCAIAKSMHRLYDEMKARDMEENPEKYAQQTAEGSEAES